MAANFSIKIYIEANNSFDFIKIQITDFKNFDG